MPNALFYNAEGVHRLNYLYIKISKLLLHINSITIIMVTVIEAEKEEEVKGERCK